MRLEVGQDGAERVGASTASAQTMSSGETKMLGTKAATASSDDLTLPLMYVRPLKLVSRCKPWALATLPPSEIGPDEADPEPKRASKVSPM